MAETPAAHRLKLFDRFSRNYSLWVPEYPDVFVCPLCQQGFNRLALEGDNPAVNLAHVIPACLGGRFCTLTCSECNSRGGTDLEAALAERLDADDVRAGVGRVRGRMYGATFGDVAVEWEMSPDWKSHSIYCVPRASDKAKLDALYRYLDERTSRPGLGVEFSLTPDYDHQPGPVRAAVYQSAFLLMFSYFGYQFALHPTYQPLREQILRPEEDVWSTAIECPAPALLGGHRQAVVFLREPPAVLAVLRLRRPRGRERVFAVVLPGPGEVSPPALPRGVFHGSTILYRPEALVSTRSYLHQMWNAVQRPSR